MEQYLQAGNVRPASNSMPMMKLFYASVDMSLLNDLKSNHTVSIHTLPRYKIGVFKDKIEKKNKTDILPFTFLNFLFS
jgi:hypothetical protein